MGWGALVETSGGVVLAQKPAWHDNSPEQRLRLLQRIALAGTRALNGQLGVTFEEIVAERHRA